MFKYNKALDHYDHGTNTTARIELIFESIVAFIDFMRMLVVANIFLNFLRGQQSGFNMQCFG